MLVDNISPFVTVQMICIDVARSSLMISRNMSYLEVAALTPFIFIFANWNIVALSPILRSPLHCPRPHNIPRHRP